MRITRFYCPASECERLSPGALITLPPNAAIHAIKVLRLNPHDRVVLFNGDGQDYDALIHQINKHQVLCKVTAVRAVDKESALRITLAQAISAGDRMDITIQKAVELGVSHIQPIASQRSVVKLSAERAEKRLIHWQSVASAACEQSGRALVPQIAAPLSLAEWLANKPPHAHQLMLSPHAEQAITSLRISTPDISLLIGAEGGFSESELALAQSQGFVSVRMGPRVLRTETAALSAIATLQALFGDFSR